MQPQFPAHRGTVTPKVPRKLGTLLPRPFLKWAGGKTQLLDALLPYFPECIPRYVEPFVGSAAVFFCLSALGRLAGSALLADSNAELVNVYRTVRDEPEDLIRLLSEHREAHGKEHYYEVRSREATPDATGAARFIYLNKTCYNGLYRVNQAGLFNVPMGDYRRPAILQEELLRAASVALRHAEVVVRDFRDTLASCGEGDLLYLDPPYVPLSATSSFTGYIPGGFGPQDQADLAECVRQAASRGARFVLSNSDTPAVRGLYSGFQLSSVPARRMINCDSTRRGPVAEAIVTNLTSGG
ncbi:MAG TPA: DNA adenine methylase [Armatimonadota bacterium]